MSKTETASAALRCGARRLKGVLGAESSGLPLKATPGFEPGVEVLQTSALPLGDVAALSSF